MKSANFKNTVNLFKDCRLAELDNIYPRTHQCVQSEPLQLQGTQLPRRLENGKCCPLHCKKAQGLKSVDVWHLSNY